MVAFSCLNAQLAALAQTATLITTFTNPTPTAFVYFGNSVAAVGNDRVLISAPFDSTGAPNAGAAHLFNTNGTLLTTFTNPTPAAADSFGNSVAAVGSDRVLIGAYLDDTGATDAGVAYLFSTSGSLLTTFTNPTPANSDYFGRSLAALGNDRVLIGADQDNTGATDAGAAYLFRTDGTLLSTFTNPAPVNGDSFGFAVATIGGDRVLIGAPYDNTGQTDAGAAYLFSTNGTLLTTFTNPVPANDDYFGYSVAAFGNERVLIGADGDDAGAPSAGAAYLFSTNGMLLTAFTNPTPAAGDNFSSSIAKTASDLVLIGAFGDDTGETDAGAAYLFSTNGTLLATLTNPSPESYDGFGNSVAVTGSDWLLIGTPGDNTGDRKSGVAYLFNITSSIEPSLTIWRTTTNALAVSWSSLSTSFTLQQNINSVSSMNWSNVTDAIQDDGTNKTLIINPPTGNRLYRLFKP